MIRPRHFDRAGRPITLWEWAAKLEDTAYRRIAEDTLPDGRWVSTVWLGLDHSFGGGPPVIFETMVFNGDSADDMQRRYSTEAEARAGHAAIVAELTASATTTTPTARRFRREEEV